MNAEQLFIGTLRDCGALVGAGDDGVLLALAHLRSQPLDSRANSMKNARFTQHFAHISHPHKCFVIAADGFCEHIHFKREWLSLEQIAHKAMLVNISDIVAMNAKPMYALLSITLPTRSGFSLSQVRTLAQSLAQSAKAHGVRFIGGDTMSGRDLALHITMIGVLRGKPLLRKGLRVGDLVYCTGRVGGSLYALSHLLKGGVLADSRRFSRFIAPRLRGEFIHTIAPFAHVGLDVSDGVLSELHTLAKCNHLRFHGLKKSRIHAYKSGEEYEVLFAIDPRDRVRLARLAKRARVGIELVGRAGRVGKIPKPKTWH